MVRVARKVPDFCHLAKHVHRVLAKLYREGSEAGNPRAEAALARQRAWEVEALLRELAGEGASGAETLRKLAHYLQANRSRMDYPALEPAGYSIGSGVVESGCKQPVHARHC